MGWRFKRGAKDFDEADGSKNVTFSVMLSRVLTLPLTFPDARDDKMIEEWNLNFPGSTTYLSLRRQLWPVLPPVAKARWCSLRDVDSVR